MRKNLGELRLGSFGFGTDLSNQASGGERHLDLLVEHRHERFGGRRRRSRMRGEKVDGESAHAAILVSEGTVDRPVDSFRNQQSGVVGFVWSGGPCEQDTLQQHVLRVGVGLPVESNEDGSEEARVEDLWMVYPDQVPVAWW